MTQSSGNKHLGRRVALKAAAGVGFAAALPYPTIVAAQSSDPVRFGVIIGTGGGSQEFTEEQYRLYHSGHWRQCSVYVVPTSTM